MSKEIHSADIDKYSIRMYKNEYDYPYIVYSYNQTRLETVEYDSINEARKGFRVICSIIRNVLQCEAQK
jgi:hypothetical protein